MSTEKIHHDTKMDEEIQDKTFVIFGANGNWIIDKLMRELGWKPLTDKYSNSFKLKWVESRLSINYENFREGQQLVNRIPNCYMLTNKLGLLVNLHRFHLRCVSGDVPDVPQLKLSNFLPETYRIDDQKDRDFFAHRFKPGEIWISKPIGLNQGRGIYLVRDASQYRTPDPEKESKGSRLIQRYISNPLLIDGRKFDIRVYMLIASTKPFLVLFRTGYVRLSLHKYEENADDITVHLTNQFIQRRSNLYESYKNETILSFEKFNDYINNYVVPHKRIEHDWVFKSLTEQMKNIALFSFLSVKDKLRTKAGFFDLYGIDFLIDDNMKVWLLEVNVNPCLSTNCDHLKQVIPSIIQETLSVSIECFNKSWDKLPLLPCTKLKHFQVLYYDCVSGFDYTKNPLSYAMSRLPSSSLAFCDGCSQTPRKKNIISVVFENDQEENKRSKTATKSMFEINPFPSNWKDSSIEPKSSFATSVGPTSGLTAAPALDGKEKPLKGTLPKIPFKQYEGVKKTVNTRPQTPNELETKITKFLVKSDNQQRKDSKIKQNQIPNHAKKFLKTKPAESGKASPMKCTSSLNYESAYTNAEMPVSITSSVNDVSDEQKTLKSKKQKKGVQQMTQRLSNTLAQELIPSKHLLQDIEEKINSKFFSIQQASSNPGHFPSSLKPYLKGNPIDDKPSMPTMKILKTLRPPGTSSIKPDYIATNKLLLQTMSKMNAERKIKNLQDTYYNQSITQLNF